MRGKIKWFNEERKYGFIKSKDGKEIFVHASEFMQGHAEPKAGDEVEYEIGSNHKGDCAVNVYILDNEVAE